MMQIALVVGVLLMAIKFIAYWITHSNAILSDALESIINVIAGAFALYSLWLSNQPRDTKHPYGHGKVEFLSAGFEGALILGAGIFIIGKAVYNLIYPQELHALDIGIYLTVFAGGVNFLLGIWLERKGRKRHSPVMIANGKHLQSDAWTSAGLILGLLLIFLTGIWWLDQVVAMVFGVIILWTGYRIVRKSVAGIMDEADLQLLEDIITRLNDKRADCWIDIHNFRVIKYGPTLHIDCHLTIPWYFDVRRGHDEITAVENIVDASHPHEVELFIHTDPCLPPESCRICPKTDCKVREADMERKLHWNLENVMPNVKHSL